MTNITYEIEAREVINGLNKLKRKANLRPIMGEIAETVRNSVEENFKKESSRGALYPSGRGTAWAELAPSTIQARKRKGKYPGRKLQVTGQLLASIQADSSNAEAIVGTNKKYAKFLQLGTSKMPARPFMVLQKSDMQEIEQIVTTHINRL